jgi:thiamine-monophosphate kinase
MKATRLGEGAEFDLIRRLTADWSGGSSRVGGVTVGPGDDAAVLEDGWVVSTDLAVEGVHFRRDWLSPDEIGGRAVAAALSDLAAMAAEPIAILLSMAGSVEDRESGLLEAVGMGARGTARSCGAVLIGGDLSRSPGPLVIDVVALGRTMSPVLRSGARVGDALYVTGRLGGAAAALEFLQRGERPPEELRRRFARPSPRLRQARLLASSGELHALMDVSDGLAGDVRHLAAASGVGIDVDVDTVPAIGWVEAGAPSDARRRALTGGEDYELLFAAAPSIEDTFKALASAFPDVPVTRVGRVVAGGEVRFLDSDGSSIDPGGGWDHFDSPARGEPT